MDGGEGGGGEEDGGEVLHHENTTDIRFTLLQWVCILFVRL